MSARFLTHTILRPRFRQSFGEEAPPLGPTQTQPNPSPEQRSIPLRPVFPAAHTGFSIPSCSPHTQLQACQPHPRPGCGEGGQHTRMVSEFPKGSLQNASGGKVTQGNRAEVAGRSCWGERPQAARSFHGGGRWPLTQPPISARGPPSQPTVRWFEPKKAKVVSQLLPCFLGPACQIPAKFLLLLFLAPSFSSLCYLLTQTPQLVSKSPQLNTLPLCSPGELSGTF